MANYDKRPNHDDEHLDETFEREISETVHAVGDAVQTVVTAVSQGVKEGLKEGAKRAASTATEYAEKAKQANNGAAPYGSQTANNVGYNYAPKYNQSKKGFFDGAFGKKKPDYAKKARSERESAGGLALVCGILAMVAINIGTGLGAAIVGFISFWFGVSMLTSLYRSGKYRRIASCTKTIGDRTNCAVSEIASVLGKSDMETVKFLRRCISDGTFTGVFISPDNKRLFTSETAYNIYVDTLEKNYKKQQETPKQEPKTEEKSSDAPKTVLDECRDFYAELKHQNELIDDAAVTEQVDKIEKHMQTLITYLDKNPDKSPRVKRFTSYYLPTTVRLLETYNAVEPNSDESTVAANIQTDIVGILYTINKAFATLEDGLMEDTALNVSAEIAAMQAMLAQDGLSGDDFKTTTR